jgi:hypothetical protein
LPETPLNFVSSSDIVGGGSGSPVVSRSLELVGVAFDGNLESLPGAYIFRPEVQRTIAVDARAMPARASRTFISIRWWPIFRPASEWNVFLGRR